MAMSHLQPAHGQVPSCLYFQDCNAGSNMLCSACSVAAIVWMLHGHFAADPFESTTSGRR